jgi:hypothetical protein
VKPVSLPFRNKVPSLSMFLNNVYANGIIYKRGGYAGCMDYG